MLKIRVKNRLKELQGSGTEAELARKLGVNYTTMKSYLSGSVPSLDKASAMAEAGGFSLDWLIGKTQTQMANEEFFEVPYYLQASASAGSGSLTLAPSSDRFLRISEEWISHSIPRGAELGVIEIRGDSMYPTLIDGDLVVVNFNVDRQMLAGGGIFVFTADDLIYVKRMILEPYDKLIVTPDNPSYAPRVFDLSAEDKVTVHGKVVWVAGEPRPNLRPIKSLERNDDAEQHLNDRLVG